MAIKDLEVRQGNVDLVVEVVEVGEIREFNKFGKAGRVASATVKDESGEIKLSLWNEQIDQVKAGQKVHVTNGYVNEFQGELQLTTGKFGKLEVLEEGKESIIDKAKDVVEDIKEKVEEVVEAVEEKLHIKKPEESKEEEKKEEIEEKVEEVKEKIEEKKEKVEEEKVE